MSEYIILKRNSGLIPKIDWYTVGNSDMLRHASSEEDPNRPQCKFSKVILKIWYSAWTSSPIRWFERNDLSNKSDMLIKNIAIG